MPAIRPERLQQRAAEIAAAIDDPDELQRRLLDLLDFHADRTRRSPQTTSAEHVVNAFGVPHPVLAAVERSLTRALEGDPGRRVGLARQLWRMGYRETRQLAASVLAGVDWGPAHQQVEEFTRQSQDRRIQRELADRGLAGWQQAERSEMLAAIARWLRARDQRVLRLALLAIRAQVATTSPTALRPYYLLLERLPPRVHQAAGAELQEVVAALASQNPAEAAQFLKDELRRENRHPAHRQLVERSLSSFPEPQRAELAAILSR